jgi:hypothetical protein
MRPGVVVAEGRVIVIGADEALAKIIMSLAVESVVLTVIVLWMNVMDELDVWMVASRSGNLNVRSAVVPVAAQMPSPMSVHGCPGFGVTPWTFVTIENTIANMRIPPRTNGIEGFLCFIIMMNNSYTRYCEVLTNTAGIAVTPVSAAAVLLGKVAGNAAKVNAALQPNWAFVGRVEA